MAEEQVELELEQEQDTEVEVPEGDKKEETALVAETEQTDNFEKAESATQKRIDRLTKKVREAERQREEAISYAQKIQAESLQLKERMNTLDTNYVSEFSNRVQSELQAAEAEMKKAMELNDTQGVVEAQRKMTNLAIQNDRAEQAKQQQEYNTKQQTSAEDKQMAQNKQQIDEIKARARRPSPKAEAWAQKNEWFGQDEAMTYAAFGIHKKMIEDEGFDAESDEYYTELDRRVQKEFPHKFNGGSKRPAQTVASVSRTTTGRTSNRKVRLTPSQVAIAKRLGVPIEEYAKHVKE